MTSIFDEEVEVTATELVSSFYLITWGFGLVWGYIKALKDYKNKKERFDDER